MDNPPKYVYYWKAEILYRMNEYVDSWFAFMTYLEKANIPHSKSVASNFSYFEYEYPIYQSFKSVRPIVATTVYDSVMAQLADQAGIDILLVGDSVGTTLLGFTVTLDMMLHHTSAVSRAGTMD